MTSSRYGCFGHWTWAVTSLERACGSPPLLLLCILTYLQVLETSQRLVLMVVCPYAPGLQEPPRPLEQTRTEVGGTGEAALISACNHMLCVFLGTMAALSTEGKSRKLLSAARRGVCVHGIC